MTECVQNNSRDFWLEEGCFLCQSARYAEALAYIDRAIALSSNDCQAWNYRGNALSGMKGYGEALAAYERAVTFAKRAGGNLAPEYHQAWFNRGLLLVEMGALSRVSASQTLLTRGF
jgi:tetratricopeptide (TPR) repeat protein